MVKKSYSFKELIIFYEDEKDTFIGFDNFFSAKENSIENKNDCFDWQKEKTLDIMKGVLKNEERYTWRNL